MLAERLGVIRPDRFRGAVGEEQQACEHGMPSCDRREDAVERDAEAIGALSLFD